MKKFAEHDVVEVTRDIDDATRTPIKKGSTGTVVHIYEKGLLSPLNLRMEMLKLFSEVS